MAKPSLAASPYGIDMAEKALTTQGLLKKDLLHLVGCSRQPITNFFRGDAIAQDIFKSICEHLSLNWQEIAGLSQPNQVKSPVNPTQDHSYVTTDLSGLIQALRQKVFNCIKEQCGVMRVLDMSHPMEINDIYTQVNILEQITGRRHRTLEQVLQNYHDEEFDRFGLSSIIEERMDGLKAVKKYQKLIILGKPGAGKTTFLKYLAIQCNLGKFEPQRVPIFITLKDFAETPNQPSLIEYITQTIVSYTTLNLSQNEQQQWLSDLKTLFFHGKSLILLDGLDEVKEEDHQRVIKEIREFSDQFSQNHFVITCRIAAWEYTFEKFTEVEIADFAQPQIKTFIEKWFKNKSVSANQLIYHLEQNPRLLQLAVSPLLLTLVCLAFEESGNCPNIRSELYKEGIDALLKKWDAKRGIQRDQKYKQLSHQKKEDLLTQLAFTTFKEKHYFFKQEFAEQFIADFISKFPNINLEELQPDSEAILKSIEAQHGLLVERAKGIYSFSHLTFHEYFVAKEIVFHSPSLEIGLEELMEHISEPRWREVVLLTAEMLRDGSQLLLPIKQKADQLIGNSDKLKSFLSNVSQLATAPEFSSINTAAVRAFFFDIDFDIDQERKVALQLDRKANLLICSAFLKRMVKEITTLKEAFLIIQRNQSKIDQEINKIMNVTSANAVTILSIDVALQLDKLNQRDSKNLKKYLHRLTNQETDAKETKEMADKVREIAKNRCHIGDESYDKNYFNFTKQEKEILKQYYYLMELLVEALNNGSCMLSLDVRQQILETVFTV